MTPEQHNKYLGWAHIAHGGLLLLMVIAMMIFMTAMILLDPPSRNQGPPVGLLAVLWAVVGVIYGVILAPSFIAGYALLKRKPWAKIAAIIAGVMSSMSAPIGVAVSVYTFWFLFSEPGKSLYDRPRAALPPQSINWETAANQSQREPQFVPPPTPPDWR